MTTRMMISPISTRDFASSHSLSPTYASVSAIAERNVAYTLHLTRAYRLPYEFAAPCHPIYLTNPSSRDVSA